MAMLKFPHIFVVLHWLNFSAQDTFRHREECERWKSLTLLVGITFALPLAGSCIEWLVLLVRNYERKLRVQNFQSMSISRPTAIFSRLKFWRCSLISNDLGLDVSCHFCPPEMIDHFVSFQQPYLISLAIFSRVYPHCWTSPLCQWYCCRKL